MRKVLNEYLVYCKEKLCLSEYCIRERARQIGLFLDFAATQGATSFKKISPKNLSDFITTLWRFSNKTVSRIVSDLRQFLKYLFLRDLITHDLSQALPTVHVPRYSKVPSV